MSRVSRSWTWRHAITQSDLPATTRHVLLTISCFMNDTGDGCYPTTAQLAEATGLSERAVITHIQAATTRGWLSVTVHGFKGQKWKNHQYQALWPDEKGTEPNDEKALNEVQQQGTEQGSARRAKALNVVPKGTEPNDEKALNEVQSTSPVTTPITKSMSEQGSDVLSCQRKKQTYSEAFEAFWHAYPRTPTMSKKEAFDAWRKLDADDKTACTAAVVGFAAYCKANPDYPPIHACRFILKRRFDGFADQSTVQPRTVTDEDWQKRLNHGRAKKRWHIEAWGPIPGMDSCRVPTDLLQPDDGLDWTEWKA